MGASDLECIECGAAARDEAAGWIAVRVDDPDTDTEPEVAIYCPGCAEREFGD